MYIPRPTQGNYRLADGNKQKTGPQRRVSVYDEVGKGPPKVAAYTSSDVRVLVASPDSTWAVSITE